MKFVSQYMKLVTPPANFNRTALSSSFLLLPQASSPASPPPSLNISCKPVLSLLRSDHEWKAPEVFGTASGLGCARHLCILSSDVGSLTGNELHCLGSSSQVLPASIDRDRSMIKDERDEKTDHNISETYVYNPNKIVIEKLFCTVLTCEARN